MAETRRCTPTPASATRAKVLAWVVPALFLMKASILGLRIVGRWEVPDEEGHFAYARDLWTGRGVRPLGEALIDPDIMTDLLERRAPAVGNWIVQHPPLYHVAAGAAWKAATMFTEDPNLLFRAPRLVSAFFGAMTLFYVYKITYRMGCGVWPAFATAAACSAIVPFTWLASGTNHDTMVAALSAASAFYFADFMLGRRPFSALVSAFLIGAAAGTKITALAVLTPLVTILVLECSVVGGWRRWAGRAAALAAVSMLLPGLWLMRNHVVYADAFATAPSVAGSQPLASLVGTSALHFLRSHSIIERFFVDFFGTIGVFEETQGARHAISMPGPQLAMYGVVVLVVVGTTCSRLAASVWPAWLARGQGAAPPTLLSALQSRLPLLRRNWWPAMLVAIAFLGLPFALQVSGTGTSRLLILPGVLLTYLACGLSLSVFVLPYDQRSRLMLYSLCIIGVFAILFVRQLFGRFQELGSSVMAARYAYAAIGFVVVGLIGPALLTLPRWADRIALTAALFLCLVDVGFMFTRLIPFFAGSS